MFSLHASEASVALHQARGPCMGPSLKEEPSLHVPTAHHPYAQLPHHHVRASAGWMQPPMLDQAAVAR